LVQVGKAHVADELAVALEARMLDRDLGPSVEHDAENVLGRVETGDVAVVGEGGRLPVDGVVTLSELPEALGGTVVRSELTYMLVRLDKEYTERRVDERWEDPQTTMPVPALTSRVCLAGSFNQDSAAPLRVDRGAFPG
jgi:hypothetical protein